MSGHEQFMQLAINVAERNPAAPFGAVLVDRRRDVVVAEGLNQVSANPIVHGEIDAINGYAASGGGNWHELRLYSTAEPCCMCQAAIMWAGIPEVVFGTSIDTLTELGWRQFDLRAVEVEKSTMFAKCHIVGEILTERCDQLFREARA
jgi:tRNA(adenine34) deaminase